MAIHYMYILFSQLCVVALGGKVVIEGNNTAGRNLIGASEAGGDHDVKINCSSILPNQLIPHYCSPGSKRADTTTALPKEEAKSDLKTYDEMMGIVIAVAVALFAIVAIIGLTFECRRRRGQNPNGGTAAGQVNHQANVSSSHTTTETSL